MVDEVWQSVAFSSRKLSQSDSRYSTFGLELLVGYLAMPRFRYFLEGQELYILTDHKPLTYASTAADAAQTPREIRQLAYILEFTSDIRHICGKNITVADALCRIEVSTTINECPPVNFAAMSTAQREDNELHAIRLKRL